MKFLMFTKHAETGEIGTGRISMEGNSKITFVQSGNTEAGKIATPRLTMSGGSTINFAQSGNTERILKFSKDTVTAFKTAGQTFLIAAATTMVLKQNVESHIKVIGAKYLSGPKL